MKKRIRGILKFLPAVFIVFFIVSCGVKDSDLQAQINQKIQTTPEMTGVTATVNKGVVTLSGECKDEASKAYTESTIKSMKGVKSVVNNTTIAAAPVITAPVEINVDTVLVKGVTDATKDYKDVKATVNDGVIILTGEIKRSDLQKLMVSLNSLKPKKIDNQLVIK